MVRKSYIVCFFERDEEFEVAETLVNMAELITAKENSKPQVKQWISKRRRSAFNVSPSPPPPPPTLPSSSQPVLPIPALPKQKNKVNIPKKKEELLKPQERKGIFLQELKKVKIHYKKQKAFNLMLKHFFNTLHSQEFLEKLSETDSNESADNGRERKIRSAAEFVIMAYGMKLDDPKQEIPLEANQPSLIGKDQLACDIDETSNTQRLLEKK